MILQRLKKFLPHKDNWEVEGPTIDVCGRIMFYDGTIYDYCTKCGKHRIHPDNEAPQ